MGTPREPKPIARIDDDPEAIGRAIYEHARKYGPHVPIHVYVRQGDVYAIRSVYRSCEVWDRRYPECFVGSYTRRASADQISADMQIVQYEYADA